MNRLKELRKKKGLTQAQFGALWNAPQNTVSNWENGNREISNELLMAFSEYFGVSVDYLLGRDVLPVSAKQNDTTIEPHTYYAERFGPETQRIVDDLLARLQAMPESRQADAARGALTYVRGVVSADDQEDKA